MKSVNFFKKKKSPTINSLFPDLKLEKNLKFIDIKTLDKSKKLDLTFFESLKYKEFALSTKASYCITTQKLEKFLPKNTKVIIVKNVLFELAKVLKKIYLNDVGYQINIENTVINSSNKAWAGRQYRQIRRESDGEGRSWVTPTFTGAAYYDGTYNKVSYGDISETKPKFSALSGWIAMMEHYFVSSWYFPRDENNLFYTKEILIVRKAKLKEENMALEKLLLWVLEKF